MSQVRARHEPVGVERVGDARLPTDVGEFRIVSYRASDGHEHVALIAGDVEARASQPVLVRLHSECLTGDALGSAKCDCGQQLTAAQLAIRAESDAGGAGLIVYLRGHEGRGIGLANKIKAYELQDRGLDTVDANTAQGLPVDARRYDVAAAILHDLGVDSVRLISNNPAKANGLEEHGVAVTEMVPTDVAHTAQSRAYLASKRARLQHLG
ncbi:MAG: GTP cyclohydrolase II [Ilumatobacter sp.]|uniref:GTP cyclohydrolase II n=1 Tax=Ilumatobacter sp. TaxID=1967498 RepID=UPI003C72801D